MTDPMLNISIPFHDPATSNVILKVENTLFHVSQKVLSAWSKPLANCVTSAMKENCDKCCLSLTNIEPHIVCLLLQFFYYGNTPIFEKELTPMKAWKLLLLSDLLCVDALILLCQNYLNDWLLKSSHITLSSKISSLSQDEDNKLRFIILINSLRRHHHSSAFSVLHKTILHLILNTPSSKPIKVVKKFFYKKLEHETSLTHNSDRKNSSNSSWPCTKFISEIPSYENSASTYVPQFILELRLLDFCSLLSSDAIQLEESVLLEWCLAYSAYYGKRLALKFLEDKMEPSTEKKASLINIKKMKKRYHSLTTSCTTREHQTHVPSMKKLCLKTSRTTSINKENKFSHLTQSSLQSEPTLDCSSFVDMTLLHTHVLIPQDITSLNFFQLSTYFELSEAVLRSILCKQFFFNYVSLPTGLVKSKHRVYRHGRTMMLKDSKTSMTLFKTMYHKQNIVFGRDQDEVWFSFLHFFFEGYIFASLERFLRYSALDPIYLQYLRMSPICSQHLVMDAISSNVKQEKTYYNKQNTVVSSFSVNSEQSRYLIDLKIEEPDLCMRRNSSVPTLLIHQLQRKIFRLIQKKHFFLLPTLLSQYASLLKHGYCKNIVPVVHQQSTKRRLTYPFQWNVLNSHQISIAGYHNETMTLLVSPNPSQKWHTVSSHDGPCSGTLVLTSSQFSVNSKFLGLHYWFLRINRSRHNKIIIGVDDDLNNTIPSCSCTHSVRPFETFTKTNHLFKKEISFQSDQNVETCELLKNTVPHINLALTENCQCRQNDVIIVSLDLRLESTNVSFFCARPNFWMLFNNKLQFDSNIGCSYETDRVPICQLASYKKMKTQNVTEKKQKLFVSMCDKDDSISLLPYEYDLIRQLPCV